jgi:hypothetical protein
VIRTPAGKLEEFSGLSLELYTLFHTPEVPEAILGPVESPTDALAELLSVSSAATRGITRRTTTPRATNPRSVTAREKRKILGIRKRGDGRRMVGNGSI